MVVEATTLVVVVPGRAVVVVVGTVVVVVDKVVLVVLEVVVLEGATPEAGTVVFGLEIVVAVVVGTVLVGGAPTVVGVVVVGWASGTGGPIPLERDGGFVVGTGTVGTGTVGTGTVCTGALVVACLVGAVVVVGGAYLGGVVVGGVELGGVVVRVVRAVVAVCGGVVVEVVEPVAGPGTSPCAVRVTEPKASLSLAFCAASLVSRAVWTASSAFRAAIASVSLAVDGWEASGAGTCLRMAFEARSMYCLALAESCLARKPLAYWRSTWTWAWAWVVAEPCSCKTLESAAPPTTPMTKVTAAATSNRARSRRLAPRTAKAAARTSVRPALGNSGIGSIAARNPAARLRRSSVGAREPARRWACAP